MAAGQEDQGLHQLRLRPRSKTSRCSSSDRRRTATRRSLSRTGRSSRRRRDGRQRPASASASRTGHRHLRTPHASGGRSNRGDQIAREEGVPYHLLRGRKNGWVRRPRGTSWFWDTMHAWTWNNTRVVRVTDREQRCDDDLVSHLTDRRVRLLELYKTAVEMADRMSARRPERTVSSSPSTRHSPRSSASPARPKATAARQLPTFDAFGLVLTAIAGVVLALLVGAPAVLPASQRGQVRCHQQP